MTPVIRYQEHVARFGWIIILLVLATSFFLLHAAVMLPEAMENESLEKIPERLWPEVDTGSVATDWTVFQNRSASVAAHGGSIAKLLRLAGTFLPLGEGARKAIFDNLKTGNQSIASENDDIEGNKVIRIYRDRVVLRGSSGEEQLWLSFSGSGSGETGKGDPETETGEVDSFESFGGKRVGTNSWVFSKKAMVDYYSELMDNPRRLLTVFNSLKPVRDQDGGITGYYLGVEGEKGFFDGVQLKEGDIIRTVNSMPMINRRRAEYFISEFANDRANAFVLEVERGGKMEKLVYQVR